MAMIKVKADFSKVIESFERIKDSFTSPEKVGRYMSIGLEVILAEAIRRRLGVRTSTSGYDQELGATMSQLDKAFVARLAGQSLNSVARSDWADVSEAERRAPGGYRKGQITKAISNAIKASHPMKIPGGVGAGLAKFSDLNNLFPQLGVEKRYKLWQIINYGTGTLGAGGSPVIRTGKQIFYNRKVRKGFLAYTTINPGFKGREFFVKMDGSMHRSDLQLRDFIMSYLTESFKGNIFIR